MSIRKSDKEHKTIFLIFSEIFLSIFSLFREMFLSLLSFFREMFVSALSFFSENFLSIFIGIIIIDIAFLYAAWSISGATYEQGTGTAWSIPLETLASFGDSMGAINALFSGLALFSMVIAIRLQSKELELQRKELRATTDELKRSATAHETAQNEQSKQNNFIKYFQHQDIFIDRFRKQIERFNDIFSDADNSILLQKRLYNLLFPSNTPDNYAPILSTEGIDEIDLELVRLSFNLDEIQNKENTSSGLLGLLAHAITMGEEKIRRQLLASDIEFNDTDMYHIDFFQYEICDYRSLNFRWSDTYLKDVSIRLRRYAQFINEIKIICDNNEGLYVYFPAYPLEIEHNSNHVPERKIITEIKSCKNIEIKPNNQISIKINDDDYAAFKQKENSQSKPNIGKQSTTKFNVKNPKDLKPF